MSPLVNDSLVLRAGDGELSAADKPAGVTPDCETAVAVRGDPVIRIIRSHVARDPVDGEGRGLVVHDDPVRILVEHLTFLLATGKEKQGGTHYRVKYLFHALFFIIL